MDRHHQDLRVFLLIGSGANMAVLWSVPFFPTPGKEKKDRRRPRIQDSKPGRFSRSWAFLCSFEMEPSRAAGHNLSVDLAISSLSSYESHTICRAFS